MTDNRSGSNGSSPMSVRLYDLYAKHLEPEHNGKFVAKSFDGEVTVGKRDREVLKHAVDMFGRGGFAMAGSDTK